MKIAIVRGPYLNRFEMQNFEPLAKKHQITAFYTNNNFFDVRDIRLPKQEIKTLESVFGKKIGDYLRIPLHFPWGYYHHMIGLERQLKGFDIAHGVETFMAHSLQLVRAKKRFGTKVVLTCWENIPFAHENLLFFPKIKKIAREGADLFLAVTERAKIALMLEGVPEEKIAVLPYGVDLKRFRPAAKDRRLLKKLALTESDLVILFVGRLTREKGILELLHSHKLLVQSKQSGPTPILVIAGDGPLKKEILRQTKRLGLDNFVRFGNFSYDEMPKVHNLADIFVLPSVSTYGWQEQFGMVLLEAMASGVPVVTTASGSIPEVVKDAAILVQPADPLALYQALGRLVRNPKLRLKLKQAGLKRAKLFDREKIAGKLENIYKKLLKKA